jgi:NodT family efflux transporter outer membrane factor (OMF) lipoprotein
MGTLLLANLCGCADFSGIGSVAKLLGSDSSVLKAAASTAGADKKLSPIDIPSQWWRGYDDTQLNRLVDQALTDNPTLRVAQARIARAMAVGEIATAAEKVQVGAGFDATHQRFTAKGMVPPPIAGAIMDTGTVQASASWELDLFGKNRAALDAALGQVHAAQADAQAARMLLAANIVRSYFNVARIQAQLDIAQRTLEQRQQSMQLTRDRFDAGLDTQLDIQQSEGTLPDTRLQIEVLQEQKSLALNALAALCAQPAQALKVDVPALASIKSIPNPRSLPLDLLGRRADIVASRWRVEAATQDVGQARAQFYPNINLTAFAGYSSIGLDKLLQSGSEQWGIGPAIRLPLFDAGRLRANLRGKAADQDSAIESYNALVIDAVRDVSDQLASAQAIERQQAEQLTAQAHADATLAIAQQRFQEGIGNKLQVLNAQTAVLLQSRQAVDLSARALDTQVQLIRALGGGYTPDATFTSDNRSADNRTSTP